MPPYHTVVGNALTVYLDVIGDTDSGLGNPLDNIIAQLAIEWGAIAAANGWTVTFAFGTRTPPPMNALPTGINVLLGATPPPNVEVFTLTVGGGANALAATRSGRISYVQYQQGRGYIYELPQMSPNFVPSVSHEMGHVLGLTDRYYEAVCWLNNWAINRTCEQIRGGLLNVPPTDFRDGVADNIPSRHQLPRLALRLSLPMSQIMVADPQYNPATNLMSTGATLTPAQLSIITARGQEQPYRRINWIAVLGDWRRYTTAPGTIPGGASGAAPDYPATQLNEPSRWIYPAWEARPQDGGSGLLFLPPFSITPHRYACLNSSRKGRDANGDVVLETRLAAAKGKEHVFAFGGTTYNVIGVNVLQKNWMCHIRQLTRNLE